MGAKLDFLQNPNPEDVTLEEFLERVSDEMSFIRFLKALADDKFKEDQIEKEHPSSPYSSGGLGWEHNDIGGYLDAAAHCAASQYDQNENLPETNPWKRAAEILFCGKMYE